VVVERADPNGSEQRYDIADIKRGMLLHESEVVASHEEGKPVLHALRSAIVIEQVRKFAQSALAALARVFRG